MFKFPGLRPKPAKLLPFLGAVTTGLLLKHISSLEPSEWSIVIGTAI